MLACGAATGTWRNSSVLVRERYGARAESPIPAVLTVELKRLRTPLMRGLLHVPVLLLLLPAAASGGEEGGDRRRRPTVPRRR